MATGFALKPIVIKLEVKRVECHVCDNVRQVKVGFAEENIHQSLSGAS